MLEETIYDFKKVNKKNNLKIKCTMTHLLQKWI